MLPQRLHTPTRRPAAFIARNLPFVAQVALMGLEMTGLARPNSPLVWVDPADYQDELAQAVDTRDSRNHDADLQPPALRPRPAPVAVRSPLDQRLEERLPGHLPFLLGSRRMRRRLHQKRQPPQPVPAPGTLIDTRRPETQGPPLAGSVFKLSEAHTPADSPVGLSRRIAWRWPADPGDLRMAFPASGGLAGCGGQRGGRARGRGTEVRVKPCGAGRQADGPVTSPQRAGPAICRRVSPPVPSRGKARTSRPGRRDQRPCRLRLARPDCW
jgi:hypothetical protein